MCVSSRSAASISRGRTPNCRTKPRRLAVVLCGRRGADFWGETDKTPAALDFFDLKGVVEALVGDLHVPSPSYRRSSASCLHPGKAAELLAEGRVLGYFGELHPKTAEAFDMAGRRVLAGEFDLEALQAATPSRHSYTSIPRFPAALRDVAVIVPEATPADRVEAEIRAGGGDLLSSVRLFDLYRGDSITAGAKSLAYALTYQADDRTLTDKEVDRAIKRFRIACGTSSRRGFAGKIPEMKHSYQPRAQASGCWVIPLACARGW